MILTKVPVTLPHDQAPTNQTIKAILDQCLPQEWPRVPAESLLITYNKSFTNDHITISLPPPTPSSLSTPIKLFMKLHRPSTTNLQLFPALVPSKQEEAELTHLYGQSGLGARVYAFFETTDGTQGRIDEFLDARCLRPEDVEHAPIRASIARSMASFCTLPAPLLNKNPAGAVCAAITAGLRKYHGSRKLKTLGEEGGVSIARLVDYDFATRLDRVVAGLEERAAKTGWCVHDVQYMNVLVRNAPAREANQVALIDFEFAMHDYRAFDIGGHFMQKLFRWGDEDCKIADCRPYTQQEKRHFCAEYAVRWNRNTGDEDTGEMVLEEAEYGYLLAVAFDIYNMLAYMDKAGDKDPLNLAGLNKLFGEFVMQCGKLRLEI